MEPGARQGAQGMALTCVCRGSGGKTSSGLEYSKSSPGEGKGMNAPPLQVQAGAVSRLLHIRPCQPCCGMKHHKTQWLTPTITYLSPYHFGLGSCIALAVAASAVPVCLWVFQRLARPPGAEVRDSGRSL